MDFKQETWPLFSFQQYENQINPNPSYQRPAVWNLEQKQLLIDSILRGIDLPKIYLRKLEIGANYKYEIIDGQQRMRTIWDYLNHESFSLHDDIEDVIVDGISYDISGLKYSALPTELCTERIHKSNLTVVIISSATESEIADLFQRLNNGTPLTPAEVRHSMPGKFSEYVKGSVGHDFFKKLSFSNKRFAHEQVCAQLLALELEGGPIDVRDSTLTKLYESYDKSLPQSKLKSFELSLNSLNEIFVEKSRLLNRSQTINIYLLISYLQHQKTLTKSEKKDLFNWYTSSEPKRLKNPEYEIHVKSNVNSRNSILHRLQFLILDYYKSDSRGFNVSLDQVRIFSEGDKATIYAKFQGTCQLCGKKVGERSWHADHMIPWIKGGKTISENGQVLCPRCNRSKRDKILS